MHIRHTSITIGYNERFLNISYAYMYHVCMFHHMYSVPKYLTIQIFKLFSLSLSLGNFLKITSIPKKHLCTMESLLKAPKNLKIFSEN